MASNNPAQQQEEENWKKIIGHIFGIAEDKAKDLSKQLITYFTDAVKNNEKEIHDSIKKAFNIDGIIKGVIDPNTGSLSNAFQGYVNTLVNINTGNEERDEYVKNKLNVFNDSVNEATKFLNRQKDQKLADKADQALQRLAKYDEELKNNTKLTDEQRQEKVAKRALGEKVISDNQKEREELWTSNEFYKDFKSFTETFKGGSGAVISRIGTSLFKNVTNTLNTIHNTLKKGFDQIGKTITDFGSHQLKINTRLQNNSYDNYQYNNIIRQLNGVAYSPLLKTSDLYANLESMVNAGIVSNVAQRAFFKTISDAIAANFEADSPTMRSMIRVQQSDSTAARLGMQSYLTQYLKSITENTEYISDNFNQVMSTINSSSIMLGGAKGAGASAEYEYIVQKWLGALYGVGLSNTAVNNISSGINAIGSGNISGLGSGMQSLLTMAAARAGLNLGQLLSGGMDAGSTNKLMSQLVNILQEMSSSTNNIVKNQLSNIFGFSVTDLVAIRNLSKEQINSLNSSMLSSQGMYSQLQNQMSTMGSRIGLTAIMNNIMSNFTTQTGYNIASNPALFTTWKITDMIQKLTGGLNSPTVGVMGNFISLDSIENLIKTGIIGFSTLGQIGSIINQISSGIGGNGLSLLDALNINQGITNINSRGSGLSAFERGLNGLLTRKSGSTVSSTTYIGNESGDTYYNSTINAAKDQANSEADVMKEEIKDPVISYLDDIEFKDGFNSIVDNIKSMVNDGIILKAFSSEVRWN